MNLKNPVYKNFDAILENMVDGLFTVDERCTITYWNKAAEEMLGYTREEVIGHTCDILKSPTCMGRTSPDNQKRCPLFAEEAIVRRRCLVMAKNGTQKYIMKNAQVLRDATGAITGGIENIVDISGEIEKEHEINLLRRQLKGQASYRSIIGRHSSMQKIYEFVELAKNSTASVLISGESGTGKALVAQAIHESSSKKKGPFVTVNCAALAESLLESELFGHVKGAFTDAIRDRKGRFEEAHGGTIFLDEIGDLPLSMQVKLLRVLQEKVVERVGDNRPIQINARIIAATHSDLPGLISQHKFREDLYYRLNVIPVQIPPLRERKTDIPLLTEHFVGKNRRESGRCIVGCDPEAMGLLMHYSWPGNVRELENTIEYAFVTCRNDMIRSENLPELFFRSPEGPVSDERLRIQQALQSCRGRKAEAAKILGVSRVTLWKKIRQHSLEKTSR